MVSKTKLIITNVIWLISCIPAYIAFWLATGNVSCTQEKLLKKILSSNRTTRVGKKYAFDRIDSTRQYIQQVPLSSYEDYVGYIKDIGQGDTGVLTTEAVPFVQPSSGSTNPTKYIPFTPALKQQFRYAIKAWLFNLLWSRPSLLFGRSYWSITPADITSQEQGWSGQIKVNFDDEINYLGLIDKLALLISRTVPSDVSRITDPDNFKYFTLFYLVKEKNLRLLSIWSPTFLLLLLEDIETVIPKLITDIRKGTLTPPRRINESIYKLLLKGIKPQDYRAQELEVIWINNTLALPQKIQSTWPKLKIISAWADAGAKHSITVLQQLFPYVEVQPKGLISTEAFVSFPVFNRKHSQSTTVLAIRSHFYEFLPYQQEREKKPVMACDLTKGMKYEVIVTTAGGLYRYRLHDVVEIVGFFRQAPIVRFCGKLDHVVDMSGEKLNAQHVSDVLEKLENKHSYETSFQLLAPTQSGPSFSYTLFMATESNIDNTRAIVNDLDLRLQENYHYRYSRSMGQLSSPRIFLIDESNQSPHVTYLRQRAKKTRIGNIKPSYLDSNLDWDVTFSGSYLL